MQKERIDNNQLKQEERIKNNKLKAEVYYNSQIKAHIKLTPVGSLDCIFKSKLLNNAFYQISKLNFDGDCYEDDLLFLVDIYNIRPYKKRINNGDKNP